MKPGNPVKQLFKRLPFIRELAEERDRLHDKNKQLENELKTWKQGFVPPGHFYSPIPDVGFIKEHQLGLFDLCRPAPSGILFNEQSQHEMLSVFSKYYPDMPFSETPDNKHRYYLNNEYYAYSDGICLYSMMRHLEPKKFIEVGSGFSSCAALDIAEIFLADMPEFTFIEPYPDRLIQRLRPADRVNPRIIINQSLVQDTPLKLFEALNKNDILFIDSSHVSKTGSDVNFLFFEVFPRLQSGVYIHIHDIFYPFEYPQSWIVDGRAWNEVYLLHSFLEFNDKFQIVYFNHYMETIHREKVRSMLPSCLKAPTNKISIPGSIWIKKQ